MSHSRVLICRVDEPEQMTGLAAFDLRANENRRLDAAHTLDDWEAQTHRIGNAIFCRLLQAQWDLIDAQLTEAYVQAMEPTKVQRDDLALLDEGKTKKGREGLFCCQKGAEK